jgi:hypothetical protein
MSRSIFLQKPHSSDYKHYLTYLEERNTTPTNSEIVEKLKVIHRKIYYLNLLVKSLNTSDTEQNYFKEIITDLIMCMDLFSLNYMKPARMGLRASIEEFNRLLLVKIREEVRNLGVFKLNQKVKDNFGVDQNLHRKISQLLSDYSQLCDYTHVSETENFTDKLVLEDFKILNRSEMNLIFNQIIRVIENMIFIIVYQFKEEFLNFNKHKQIFIIEQLNTYYQSEINEILDHYLQNQHS